ncbi:hypothetical protein MMPV_001519 [Pyropia vietnamensis]
MATNGGVGGGDRGDNGHVLHAWAGDLPGAPPHPLAGGGAPGPWTGLVLIDCVAAAMDVWLTDGASTYHREGEVGDVVTTLPLAGREGSGGACLPLAGALMGALNQPGQAYVVMSEEGTTSAAAATGNVSGDGDDASDATGPVTLRWALPPDGGGVTASWHLGRGTRDGGAGMAVAVAARTGALRDAAAAAAATAARVRAVGAELRAVAALVAADTAAGATGEGALVTAVVAPAAMAINAIKEQAAAVEAAAAAEGRAL